MKKLIFIICLLSCSVYGASRGWAYTDEVYGPFPYRGLGEAPPREAILEDKRYTLEEQRAVDTLEKSFDPFEVTLTEDYCSVIAGTRIRHDDTAAAIGISLLKRRYEIMRFLNHNAATLILKGLSAYDMYPVAQGIVDRLIAHNRQLLKNVNLLGSEVETKGFIVLYDALINRGIASIPPSSAEATHIGSLEIVLPNERFEREYNVDYVRIAKGKGIKFIYQPFKT